MEIECLSCCKSALLFMAVVGMDGQIQGNHEEGG